MCLRKYVSTYAFILERAEMDMNQPCSYSFQNQSTLDKMAQAASICYGYCHLLSFFFFKYQEHSIKFHAAKRGRLKDAATSELLPRPTSQK